MSEPVDDQTGQPEVEATFDDFWRDIVMPNGEWDLAQVKRELSDYSMLLNNVPRIFDDLTGGRISKPNTDPQIVIDTAREHFAGTADVDDAAETCKTAGYRVVKLSRSPRWGARSSELVVTAEL